MAEMLPGILLARDVRVLAAIGKIEPPEIGADGSVGGSPDFARSGARRSGRQYPSNAAILAASDRDGSFSVADEL
jgi:hypothetical protein